MAWQVIKDRIVVSPPRHAFALLFSPDPNYQEIPVAMIGLILVHSSIRTEQKFPPKKAVFPLGATKNSQNKKTQWH